MALLAQLASASRPVGAVVSRVPPLLLVPSRLFMMGFILLGASPAGAENIAAGTEQPATANAKDAAAPLEGAQLHFARFTPEHPVTSWQRNDRHDAYYAGASWTAEDPLAGDWTINWVHNHQNDAAGDRLRDQNVISLAGERDYKFLSQRLTLEGEQAWFRGDPEWFPTRGQNDESIGSGTVLQLSGRSGLPLTYRVRFESYDEDFTPYGATVAPDRNALESGASWQFDDLQLHWRWQQYHEQASSDNPLKKSDMGLTLSGPLLAEFWPEYNLTGSLDLSERQVSDAAGLFGVETRTAALDFDLPLPADWRGRFGAQYGREENFIGAPGESTTRQLGVSAEQPFDFGGWSGIMIPGLSVRTVQGSATDGRDLHVSLGFNLLDGPHSLGWSLGYLYRDFEPLAADEGSFGFDYAYKYANQVFQLKNDVLHRNDPVAATDYRVTINWTVNYDGVPWPFGEMGSLSWR